MALTATRAFVTAGRARIRSVFLPCRNARTREATSTPTHPLREPLLDSHEPQSPVDAATGSSAVAMSASSSSSTDEKKESPTELTPLRTDVAPRSSGLASALDDIASSAASSPEPSASPDNAEERARKDPVDPRVPAGQEPPEHKPAAGPFDSKKEGQAEMDHENPSIGQVLGIESPPPPGTTGPERPDTLVEGGTENMTRAELQELIERFQPIVWLHPNEMYLPTTMARYLEAATLYYDPVGRGVFEQYVKLKPAPNPDDLSDAGLFALLDEYRRNHPEDKRLQQLSIDNMVRRSFHMKVADDQRFGGPWSEVNKVPFYSRVRKYADRFEILYVTLYAFNGPFFVCGRECDPHSADVEHITVRTNKEGTKLEWIYMGAHGRADGVWRRPSQMEVVSIPGYPWPTRAVVYSSLGSHGVYPEAKNWCRICCFANDITGGPRSEKDKSNAWDPVTAPVLLLDPRDRRYMQGAPQGGTRWLVYPGTLGEDGVDAIQGQGWWDAENEYQNNFFRRALWPCRYCDCNNDMCYNVCQSKVDFSQKDPEGPPTNQGQMER